MDRIVYHIDVNSAYLSWTAIDILKKENLDIRLIPSVIGGERDKRSGIVLSKSIPSKKYGISVGEPVNMALQKCHNLYVAKPDFESYQKHSSEFMKLCTTISPVVEQFSIDECYMDMTGLSEVYGDLVKYAYKLKDRIHNELGFTVNIGVGNNKFLAKMASDFEKPDKVHTLFANEIEEKMYPLPISDLYLVGRRMNQIFLKAGVRTIRDLSKLNLESIQKIAGNKMGEVYYDYVHGIDDTPVISDMPDVKSYSISKTYEKDVTTYERAYAILLSLVDEVSSRMRKDGKFARVISVIIRNNRFEDTRKQMTISSGTDSSTEIYEIVKQLFYDIWDEREPLRLLGVGLAGLDSSLEEANDKKLKTLISTGNIVLEEKPHTMLEFLEGLNMVDDGDEEINRKNKNRNIDKAVDNLRDKYGYDIIGRGSVIRENNENAN